MHAPPKLPPPLPILPRHEAYQDKIRWYLAARREFFCQRALRRTAAIILAAAFAVIVADVFLEFSASALWIALGALACGAAILLALWWWRPARAFCETDALREIERGFPELGQRLRTAREFERGHPSDQAPASFARALVAETRQRMAAIEPRKLIPWSKLRRPGLACIAVLIAFAGTLIRWPDFRTGTLRLAAPGAGFSYTSVSIESAPRQFTDHENPRIVARLSGRPAAEATLFTREAGGGWVATKMARGGERGHFDAVLTGRAKSFKFYVAAGDGHSATREMLCIVPPRISGVWADLEFPDYTGLGIKRSEGGDVKAVEGTKARVIFQLNHPLLDASARTSDGRILPVQLNGGQAIVEHTLARGDLTYRFSGRDPAGLELEPATYKFTGVEDKIPEVKLVEPAKDLVATSVWEIVARVQAKDDFGLAEVGIILVVGDELKVIAQRDIPEKNLKAIDEMGTARLEDFPLSIHDNLKLYAYARDHKPRDGARSVSTLRAIDIRQFKTRWYLAEGADGGGAMPMSAEQLMQLDQLIKKQRQVVSDVFVLKENGAPDEGNPSADANGIHDREEQLAQETLKLEAAVEEAGTMQRDDLVLLDTAAQQMREAAGHLHANRLPPAYTQADRALSSLLEMRKLVIKLLMKAGKRGQPASGENEQARIKTLSELAKEAERLAGEERDVRNQVAPEPRTGLDPAVTRHQQEVAVTDAGELFAALVMQKDATELALQRMDKAEKEMQAADGVLHGDQMQNAGPGLQTAEDELLELAAQLRALDEKNLSETLAKFAEEAAKAEAKLGGKDQKQDGEGKKSGDDPAGAKKNAAGEGGNAEAKNDGKPGAKPSPGKQAGDQKAGPDGKAQPGQGQQPGQHAGKEGTGGEGSGEGKSGEGDSPSLDQIANQADTINDVLKSLAAREAAAPGTEQLGALRDEAKTDALGEGVRELENPKGAGNGPSAQDLAERFGKLAQGLSQAQQRLLQSLIEKLANIQAQTKELLKNKGKMPGEDPGASDQKAPANQPGNDTNDGKSASKNSKSANGKGAGGRPKDDPKQKPGKKPPGNEKPESGPEDLDAQIRGGSGGGDSPHRYIRDLESMERLVVPQLVAPLKEDLAEQGRFAPEHLRAVSKQIDKILQNLLRANTTTGGSDRIPDEYGRMVEEYFRALSDDFAGEKWSTEEK